MYSYTVLYIIQTKLKLDPVTYGRYLVIKSLESVKWCVSVRCVASVAGSGQSWTFLPNSGS